MPRDTECGPRFLASESEHCVCANARIDNEFTDGEVAAIAALELSEARAAEISPGGGNWMSDIEYQELVDQYRNLAQRAGATSAEARHRLAMASAEAGRACRVNTYEPILE